MNVHPTRPLSVAPQGPAASPRLDVTVTDVGVQARTPMAPDRSDTEPAVAGPASERPAISERVSPVYDLRGRSPRASAAGHQGRLLDVTG